MRRLELLSPARDLECGIAAIDHGADAVYIGAARFGARAAAGNSVEDIGELCRYAHSFGARVYVTVNTLAEDDELTDFYRLVDELKEVGADALLVQDMALVDKVTKYQGNKVTEYQSNKVTKYQSNKVTSIPLHASTQTDNRTPEKVAWLHDIGFRRTVLARELSLEEIREIHEQVPEMELEAFVHGALCVSYSGQCYASEYCLNRSANRGECAQMCRMRYDLLDADGRELVHQRYLLSLKDLCRIDYLEELADAGVMSFKIEGRLKDVSYVKNVTAAYSQRLDELVARRPKEYARASLGKVSYTFVPDLKKTFNRGFTDYYLHSTRNANGQLVGRQADVISPDTPKAIGEYVGRYKGTKYQSNKVTEYQGSKGKKEACIVVSGTTSFSNGDGLSYFTSDRELKGFRVNRVEGNHLYVYEMPEGLREGMALYRNHDQAFERLMAGKTAERRIPVTMTLSTTADGFSLKMGNKGKGISVEVSIPIQKQLAEKPQRENMVRQLSKLGTTVYESEKVLFENNADSYFIPSSLLAELRRKAVEQLNIKNEELKINHDITNAESNHTLDSPHSPLHTPHSTLHTKKFPYLLNITNEDACQFMKDQGVSMASVCHVNDMDSPLLMQCRHCIRYSLGACKKRKDLSSSASGHLKEPLYLRLGDGRLFQLEFDCSNCQMNVYGGEVRSEK